MAGTRITQLTPSAIPGRRLGSFGDKIVRGRITQLTPSGIPGRRYGSFSGKGTPVAAVPITQLTLSGISGRRYGVFSGKSGTLPPLPPMHAGLRWSRGGVAEDLAVVAAADYNPGMGGAVFFEGNLGTWAVLVVETTDPNASIVRFRTTTGVRAIRVRT